MRIIKTIGMQYISEDAVPVAAPPDANRPAQFLNTSTGFYYNWNIPSQEWIAIPKRYLAKLTQTGVDDPVVTVFENTLGSGVSITWTRSSEGAYSGTIVGASFSASKGVCFIGPLLAESMGVPGVLFFGTVLAVTTYSPVESPLSTDGLLANTAIELLIYP